ncbi:MAG TPA: TetR/AcrR family transcriptional regulator [Terriglobales bacterium]|nr:TetR/AcrR family transcriptional regulator [Terriglobales bacterium]
MVRPASTTRDRIILAAVELFYTQGYEATGMAQILRKSKANSGSFYFFFESKEHLLDAVLDWYLANLEPIIVRPAYAASADPIERIFALLDGYRQKIVITDFTFTCPIGRLALEIDPARRKIHEKIAANFDGWTAAVRQCLRDAADRFPDGTDFDQFAQFVLTVMEGGVMQARAHRSIVPFDNSVEQLRRHLDQLQELAPQKIASHKSTGEKP